MSLGTSLISQFLLKMVSQRSERPIRAPLLLSPKVAFETVPMYVWLNTDCSRPRRVECRPASFLHSSYLQAINAVLFWPVHVQKVTQASKRLCPAVMTHKRSERDRYRQTNTQTHKQTHKHERVAVLCCCLLPNDSRSKS